VYADASPSCNTLLFQFGPSAVGTTLATRQWNIKVSLNYIHYTPADCFVNLKKFFFLIKLSSRAFFAREKMPNPQAIERFITNKCMLKNISVFALKETFHFLSSLDL